MTKPLGKHRHQGRKGTPMKQLLLAGVVLTLATSALAYPTLAGPTGLLTVPTAAVAPAGQLQAAVDLQYVGNDELYPMRAVYGINGNWEAGATFVTGEATGDDDIWGINAKYVLPAHLGGADWAIGAAYTDSDNVSTTAAYLAATKAFDETLAGTAALLWSDDDVDEEINDQTGDDDSDFALAIGVQADLDNGLTLIGEYVNILPGASLNFAARYPLTDALTAQLGFVGDTSDTTLGINYAFGGSAD